MCRPDELKVTTSNGVVQIEGRHEETAPDGKTKLTRQFSRRSAVPSPYFKQKSKRNTLCINLKLINIGSS